MHTMSTSLEHLKAALANRYAIERELGAGGMATVYLAEDLKHQRPVAVKVLRSELGAALGPERFLREIAIAARLNHPHILTLIDSGEADGLLYYVMPYIKGESLRDRLAKQGELPIPEAVRILRDVVDALAYAHGEGLVHRDIKPDNVLLSGHHAVVTDFGVAKAVSDATGLEKLTTAGVALGTPSYMAPEQAVADPAIDHRADIYAVGAMAYEMLAGSPPLTGPNPQAVLAAQVTEVPVPVTDHRQSVPPGLGSLVMRCLEKKPADRWQAAEELLPQLEVLATPSGGMTPTGMQPLPVVPKRAWKPTALGAAVVVVVAAAGFFFVSGRDAVSDTGQPLTTSIGSPSAFDLPEWILVAEFDGPADDPALASTVRDLVTAALEQSEVVATVPLGRLAAALRSAGLPADAGLDPDLARELALRYGIGSFMVGSVNRLGSGYSTVLRVLDTDDQSVVLSLSETAANDEDLIPSLDRLVRRMREEIGEQEGVIAANRPLTVATTPSFEAFQKYSEARLLQHAEDRAGSNEPLLQALELDPEFAMAWRMLAANLDALGEADSAQDALDRALGLRDRVSETERLHIEALKAHNVDEDYEAAVRAFDRIIELNPQDVIAHYNRSIALLNLGRYADALDSYEWEDALEPLGVRPFRRQRRFELLIAVGRLDDATRLADSLEEEQRDDAGVLLAVARTQWALAESLAVAAEGHPDGVSTWWVGESHTAAKVARGAIFNADSAGANLGPVLSMLTGVGEKCVAPLGIPLSWPEHADGVGVLVGDAVMASAVGDTTTHTRTLRVLEEQTEIDPTFLRGHGQVNPPHWIASALTDAITFSDPRETVSRLRTMAWQGQYWAQEEVNLAMRWLVADAYERLGQLDSAALYFELLIDSTASSGDVDWVTSRAYAYSLALRRLARIYGAQGDEDGARERWDAFRASFDNPDPELLWMLEESSVGDESSVQQDVDLFAESCRQYADRQRSLIEQQLQRAADAQDAHFREHGAYGGQDLARDLGYELPTAVDSHEHDDGSTHMTVQRRRDWVGLAFLVGDSTGWSMRLVGATGQPLSCSISGGEGPSAVPGYPPSEAVCLVGDTLLPEVLRARSEAHDGLLEELRRLIPTQEAFFADSGEYASVDELERGELFSSDAQFDISFASMTGWIGYAWYADDPSLMCGVYVGPRSFAPHPIAIRERDPICWRNP